MTEGGIWINIWRHSRAVVKFISSDSILGRENWHFRENKVEGCSG